MSGCFRDLPEGFDAGGPITRYLGGRWLLVKIVTPSGTKSEGQIPYREVLERGNDNSNDYDKVFRDDSLVATYIWSRVPAPKSDARELTTIVTYQNGMKRYYKMRQTFSPKDDRLEASDYVTELNAPADTIRYHYIRIE